jgi:hypothetical protein
MAERKEKLLELIDFHKQAIKALRVEISELPEKKLLTKKKMHDYWKENKDKITAHTAEWREANRQKTREIAKKYWTTHREEILQRRKEKYAFKKLQEKRKKDNVK